MSSQCPLRSEKDDMSAKGEMHDETKRTNTINYIDGNLSKKSEITIPSRPNG